MSGPLNEYGIRRVYILGAGFSAAAGMPLPGELLKLICEVAETKPWSEDGVDAPHGQGDWLLEEINWYFPTAYLDRESLLKGSCPEGFDLERFLSFIAASSAFVEGTGDEWNEHGDKFTAFLKRWLGEALARRQREVLRSVPAAYETFARTLQGSLVISFNWDTVLETILDRVRCPYAFDLRSLSARDTVPILKLHSLVTSAQRSRGRRHRVQYARGRFSQSCVPLPAAGGRITAEGAWR